MARVRPGKDPCIAQGGPSRSYTSYVPGLINRDIVIRSPREHNRKRYFLLLIVKFRVHTFRNFIQNPKTNFYSFNSILTLLFTLIIRREAGANVSFLIFDNIFNYCLYTVYYLRRCLPLVSAERAILIDVTFLSLRAWRNCITRKMTCDWNVFDLYGSSSTSMRLQLLREFLFFLSKYLLIPF